MNDCPQTRYTTYHCRIKDVYHTEPNPHASPAVAAYPRKVVLEEYMARFSMIVVKKYSFDRAMKLITQVSSALSMLNGELILDELGDIIKKEHIATSTRGCQDAAEREVR